MTDLVDDRADEQMDRLDAASALTLPYPYDFIANAAKRDFGL